MTEDEKGDDFDFSDLDDPAAEIPDTEPNTSDDGTYPCEIYEVRFLTVRKTEERKCILAARICSGKAKGGTIERWYTLEKDDLHFFVKDMDRLGFGKEARKGLSAFLARCRDEKLLVGVFCEMELKTNEKGYKNAYVNKKIEKPEGYVPPVAKAKPAGDAGDADESDLDDGGIPEDDIPF